MSNPEAGERIPEKKEEESGLQTYGDYFKRIFILLGKIEERKGEMIDKTSPTL